MYRAKATSVGRSNNLLVEDGCLDGRTEILNIESNTLCATSYLPNKIKFKTPLSTVRLEYLLLDFFN